MAGGKHDAYLQPRLFQIDISKVPPHTHLLPSVPQAPADSQTRTFFIAIVRLLALSHRRTILELPVLLFFVQCFLDSDTFLSLFFLSIFFGFLSSCFFSCPFLFVLSHLSHFFLLTFFPFLFYATLNIIYTSSNFISFSCIFFFSFSSVHIFFQFFHISISFFFNSYFFASFL